MATNRPVNFIFSFHDLCPQTIPMAMAVLAMLKDHGKKEITLLLIPGLFKDNSSLRELQKLLEKYPDAELAGHGWSHKIVRKKSAYHHIHSMIISRDVGEHLSLPEAEIYHLINSCHGWFADHDLPKPEIYVPPAWAMGNISRSSLDSLPFRYYEYQFGVYDSQFKKFHHLPVIGFEADTKIRQTALIAWNYFNLKIGHYCHSLRVAIHPFDLDLKLSSDLKEIIRA